MRHAPTIATSLAYHGGTCPQACAYSYRVHPISPVITAHSGTYEIVSVAARTQTFGPAFGLPFVQVDFAGCNLQCHYCDGNLAPASTLTLQALLEKIRKATYGGLTRHVGFGGGEPLRQPVSALIEALNSEGFIVHVETNGATWNPAFDRLFEARSSVLDVNKNMVLASPKFPTLVQGVRRFVSVLRYAVVSGQNCLKDGLPIRSGHFRTIREPLRVARPKAIAGIDAPIPVDRVYVQGTRESCPLKTQLNEQAAQAICYSHGYRYERYIAS
jgi:organic radical activating enzyme